LVDTTFLVWLAPRTGMANSKKRAFLMVESLMVNNNEKVEIGRKQQ
jgi:hypothetical protein